MGRPNTALVISQAERKDLEAIVRSRSMPHAVVRRAQIVLQSADAASDRTVARNCGVSAPIVSLWRSRYQHDGLAGLHGELRPGRPRTYGDDKIAGLLRTVLQSKPEVVTHWTVRSAAAKAGISKSTVGRYFALFGVQPHRSQSFKLSTDPFFVEKGRDIVGLYLNPPDKALVLCVDEKSQIQALARSQPMLALGLGYVEGIPHNYARHGTTTLFAAFDPISGTVLSQCKRRHRHQEFLDFLRHVDASVPKAFDVHLIVDNYATHKHPRVQRWLAARPRYHMHFTPTYSSWLNQVEIWFNIITQKAIRRGTFGSVKELVAKIESFVHRYNAEARPFSWTATPDSILEKIQRLCERISGTQH